MEKKILIVEDDIDVTKLLETLIIKEGFQATNTQTADKAVSLIENQKPDLILLDLVLPKKAE